MADAEGAVQDVFLWIWDNREKWRVEGSLKTYLYSAVKYRCLDLIRKKALKEKYVSEEMANQQANPGHHDFLVDLDGEKLDRKSTRLNSSHVAISYDVLCLKKKKQLR